jgi:hypothetical protein
MKRWSAADGRAMACVLWRLTIVNSAMPGPKLWGTFTR